MMYKVLLLAFAAAIPHNILGQQLAHGLPPNPNPRPGPHSLPPPPHRGPTPAPFAGPSPTPFPGPSPIPFADPSPGPVFSPAPVPFLTPSPAPQFFGPSPHPPQALNEAGPGPAQLLEPVAHALPLPVRHPVYEPSYEPDHYNDGPSNYNFGYAVRDDYSGDDFSHTETRDGYKTTGEYRVQLPDGRTQIVSYIADENGYVADVKYEGDALPYVPHDLPHRPQYSPEHGPIQPAALPILHEPVHPAPFAHAPALRPLSSLPPRPFHAESLPVEPFQGRSFAPEPLTQEPLPIEQEPLPVQPLLPEPLPVQPLLPEPIAVVHDLKAIHSPIPRPGYIPTIRPYGPPPPNYGPTPTPIPYSPTPAPYDPQPHSPSLPVLNPDYSEHIVYKPQPNPYGPQP